MSELNLPSFELKESGLANEDGAQLILQCEAWFQAKTDLINQSAEYMKTCKSIDFMGLELTDPNVIKGFRYGLLTALGLFGSFPLSVDRSHETD